MRRYTISVKPAQRVSFLNSQVTLAEHFNGHVDVKVGDLSAAAQKGQLVLIVPVRPATGIMMKDP